MRLLRTGDDRGPLWPGLEWFEILSRIYTEPAPFDFAGRYCNLRGVSFVNYKDELPYFCEPVLPLLREAGLRT